MNVSTHVADAAIASIGLDVGRPVDFETNLATVATTMMRRQF
jgi:hypothetical protein